VREQNCEDAAPVADQGERDEEREKDGLEKYPTETGILTFGPLSAAKNHRIFGSGRIFGSFHDFRPKETGLQHKLPAHVVEHLLIVYSHFFFFFMICWTNTHILN
jgi:hypothetical protein